MFLRASLHGNPFFILSLSRVKTLSPPPLLAILRRCSILRRFSPSFAAARHSSPLLAIRRCCSPSFAATRHPSWLLAILRGCSLSIAAARHLRRCSLSVAAARHPSPLLAILRCYGGILRVDILRVDILGCCWTLYLMVAMLHYESCANDGV